MTSSSTPGDKFTLNGFTFHLASGENRLGHRYSRLNRAAPKLFHVFNSQLQLRQLLSTLYKGKGKGAVVGDLCLPLQTG